MIIFIIGMVVILFALSYIVMVIGSYERDPDHLYGDW